MQTFLAKCAALAVIAGGFLATGDLGRLAGRLGRILSSRTAPVGIPLAGHAAAEPGPAVAAPVPAMPATPGGQDGSLTASPVRPPAPPADSPRAVSAAALRAGDRLLVWVGAPASVHALDVVDPVAGELLLQSHPVDDTAAVPHHAAPSRVRLAAGPGQPAVIECGGSLRLEPVGIAHGAGAGRAQVLGPIVAVQVIPR